MIIRWAARSSEILITGALVSLALITSGNCQNPSNSEAEADDAETIEEIRVYGTKSLLRMRHEVDIAEEVFFDQFNALNSDDDFDIHCYREAKTGSRIKRRVCTANYFRRLEAEATRNTRLSLQATGSAVFLDPTAEIRKMDKLLLEKMEKLAGENPGLLKALEEFVGMKKAYEAERKEKCEGRLILCR